MKTLAILGASGHGKVIADIAEACGWSRIIFYDDDTDRGRNPGGVSVDRGWAVKGDSRALISDSSSIDAAIVAVGENSVRLQKQRELVSAGIEIATLVHPSAVVSSSGSLATGTVVMPRGVVNVDAHIGQACIVNTGATIDHDCRLEDGVHVSPGANLAGNVSVGKCAWLGIGCCVKQQIKIGENAIVGAGAVVVEDVPAGLTVIGVPAQPINRGAGRSAS